MKRKPLSLLFSLFFTASMVSCGMNKSGIENNIAEENYICSGLTMDNFDENGAARTALKCKNRQDLLSKFEVFVGHSYNFPTYCLKIIFKFMETHLFVLLEGYMTIWATSFLKRCVL